MEKIQYKGILYLTFFFLLFATSVRSDGGCALCPFWDSFVHSAERIFGGGDGSTGPDPPAQCYLKHPDPSDPSDPLIDPNTATPSQGDGSSNTEPDIELSVTGVPEPLNLPISEDQECDPLDPKCDVTSAHIIWPLDCGDATGNSVIFAALVAMVTVERVATSKSSCGTYFWTAPLTQKQIDELMEPGMYSIEVIVPDLPAELSSCSRVRSRAQNQRIVIKTLADDPLTYISTPPNIPNPNHRYAVAENSGKDVWIYSIDTGVWPDHPVFKEHDNVKRVLYALDTPLTEIDEFGHGMCMASTLCGKYGVVDMANIVMVKYNPKKMSSFIDGLKRVTTHTQVNPRPKGYSVLLIASNFHTTRDKVSENRVRNLIKSLIEDFQFVVVTSAGNQQNKELSYTEVNMWPATIAFDPDIPIISVGAIDQLDGKAYSWSHNGDGVTVWAPGTKLCNKDETMDRTLADGTSVAAALTAGEVAHTLSRRYLRDFLGLDEPDQKRSPPVSVAQKVRDYLVRKAYARRTSSNKCIWNGLYPQEPWRMEP